MHIQQRNIEDIQDDHCKLIKNILLTPPTYVEKLPFKVTNYFNLLKCGIIIK